MTKCTCSVPHVTVQISTGCHVLVVTVTARLNVIEVLLHELWLLQLLLLLLLTAPQTSAYKFLLLVLVNLMLRLHSSEVNPANHCLSCELDICMIG